MIVLQFIKGRWSPVVVCDECGDRIERDGNIFFNLDDPSLWHVLRTVHKGSCSRKAVKLRLHSVELDTFLYNLIHNTKIDMEAAKAKLDWSV